MKLFRIFLSSPGDTQEERELAKEVVTEINTTTGSRDDFRLELITWENNTYPSMGKDGQDVISTQIGDDYEIFVGLMWKRFGTPTKRAGSGTEEEFELAYSRYKKEKDIQIMFYFNKSHIPQDADLEQFQKVKDFKKKIESLGAYHFPYYDPKEFEKLLRMHLTGYVKDVLKESAKLTSGKSSDSNERVIPEIKFSFQSYLNDIEASFAHSKVDNLKLDDIYIAPDLKDIYNSDKSNSFKVKNLDEITNTTDSENVKFVLLGNDLAGKTANSKYLFGRYFELGFYPILINGLDIGGNIRSEAIQKLIEEKIQEQYEKPFHVDDIERSKAIVIIDDFHKASKGKSKFWPHLMNNIEEVIPNIIVTGNSLMPIENINKEDPFKDFGVYSILEFGPKFRYELVNKWNTIGIESRFIDQNELLRKNDIAISHINSIIGKNYIPSNPFYLLSILQAMESGNVQNPNYSIHGFYYEVLINECFSKAVKDKKEISLYYNYLTQFCFHLFELGVKDVSIEEFEKFHQYYCEKHDLTYKKETILQTFHNAKLLYVNNRVYIKEKYVYYFFVAKYIANEIGNRPEMRELITKMCERVFKDEYASIIMFVTHLSKDSFIINELIKIANTLFSASNVSKLEDDITEINNLVKKMPDQILEIVDVQSKRKEELEEQDEAEKLEKELEESTDDYDSYTLEDDVASIDFFARITRALKTIDILGQVTKKHWGELDGTQKLNLVETTYDLGLRTLDVYLDLIQKNVDDIIEHIGNLVNEKHIKDRYSLKKEIEETARNYVFKICFMAAFGVIKRVSNSIGYDKLKNTYERVLENHSYNSIKLIDLSIKLGYSNISTHIDLIYDHKDAMNKNILSMVVLQNLVIDYMYMFDTDYRTKSQICEKLGISVKEQLKIEKTSTVKRK